MTVDVWLHGCIDMNAWVYGTVLAWVRTTHPTPHFEEQLSGDEAHTRRYDSRVKDPNYKHTRKCKRTNFMVRASVAGHPDVHTGKRTQKSGVIL